MRCGEPADTAHHANVRRHLRDKCVKDEMDIRSDNSERCRRAQNAATALAGRDNAYPGHIL